MHIHFIMHESFEAPAAIELWAKNKGYKRSYTKLYEGDTFPEKCDFNFLIIMGGPQCPTTSKEECAHFDSAKEIAFIKKAVAEDKILLGICLGAQFIGEALGANFDHSPHREIGVFPITLTDEGKKDAIFSKFPENFLVGHWHGDMPGLTPDAKILATSKGCPRQIVRYAPKIYGFQCHFEFTPAAIEDMIANSLDELNKYKELPFIENPEQLRKHDFKEINDKLFYFLNEIVKR